MPDQAYVTGAPRVLPGRLDPRRRHPALDRIGGHEGDAAAARAGVRGAREREALPAAPRGQDRGPRGTVTTEIGGRCRPDPLHGGRARRTSATRSGASRARWHGVIGLRFAVRSTSPARPAPRNGPPFQDTSWFAGDRAGATTRNTSSWPWWSRAASGRRPLHPSSGNIMSRIYGIHAKGSASSGGGGLMDLVAGRV